MTQVPTTDANEAATRQFLTFTVLEEEYGVDIMTVREIKGWTETTRLPGSPAHMRGVINLRGSIIPIFDLRVRFGLEPTQAGARNVVIILAVGGRDIGLLVDAVSDILSVADADIKAKPSAEGEKAENYVSGLISIDQRMVVLLKVDALLSDDITAVSQAA